MRIKLKEVLEKQNKSQYWLSKQTNITAKQLGKIANNKTTSISFDNLEKICKALNCKIEDILELEE